MIRREAASRAIRLKGPGGEGSGPGSRDGEKNGLRVFVEVHAFITRTLGASSPLKKTGKQKGCEKDPDFAQALKRTGINWKRPAPVSQ